MKKEQYLQIIRGLCIVAVVFMHCTGTSVILDSFDGVYFFVAITIINSPVAIFFIISGYFINSSSFSLKKRITRLLVPYLIWTLVYIVVNLVLGKDFSWIWLARCLLLGEASTPFYYIIVLLAFTLITPLLLKGIDSKLLYVIVICASILCLIVAYYFELSGESIWHYLRYTIVWLPFYVFGIIIRNKHFDLSKYKRFSLALVIVSFVMELIESYCFATKGFDITLSQLKITSLVNSFAIGLFIFSHRFEKENYGIIESLLLYLGNNSYGLFYIHFIFITAITILIDKFDLLNIFPFPVLRIVEGIVVIAFSLLVIKIIKLLLRNKSKVLGV